MWRIVTLVGVLVSWPSSAPAWGFDAHKFIADRMIELLPPELKPLFEERRPFIIERSIDPDLWRTVGSAELSTLERRLNDAIASVASFIARAWEAAGKPAIPKEGPRTPRRIRRPTP
jgi:hypothetical protein